MARGDARVLDRAAIWIYGTVFFSILATGLGAPFPEELPIVASGVTCGHNRAPRDDSILQVSALLAVNPLLPFPANVPWEAVYEVRSIIPPEPVPAVRIRWYIMLPICVLGVVIGDGFLYAIGRIWGTRLVATRWMKRVLPEEKKVKIEENFHRYGVWVLLFARLLPTIRAPIYIMAGVTRVPFSLFVLADGLYAIPGVSLLFFLGYWLGDQFKDLVEAAEGKVAASRPIIVLIGLAALTAYLIHHFFRHPVATGDPRLEVPVIGDKVAQRQEQHESADQASPTSGENVRQNPRSGDPAHSTPLEGR
jgi:membrane protein DedA with SNARE-associated domain